MHHPASIVIYGASGHAAAVREHLMVGMAPQPLFDVVAFIDDFRGDRGESLDGVPVISFDTWRRRHLEIPCFVSVSQPAVRRVLVERVAAAGGSFASILRAGEPPLSPTLRIGEGSFIAGMVNVARNASLGRHAQVMTLTSLGHDCTLGDFVTICPSVAISGHVVVEDEAFVGAGAVLVDGTSDHPLRIGRGAFVCAGAVVTKSVPAGARVAGNPARPLRKLAEDRRLRREMFGATLPTNGPARHPS